MNRKFVVKLLSTIALTTLIVSVGGTVVFAGETCSHSNTEIGFNVNDFTQHSVYCTDCHIEISKENHTASSGEYYFDNTIDAKKHWTMCSVCGGPMGEAESHKYDGWTIYDDKGQHAKSCTVCGMIDDTTWGDHDTNGTDGSCSVCGYKADPGCQPTPPTSAPEKEDKEEKKESSSSSSSSKPAPSAPVTAETIRAAEGVTGSKEFVAKQTTMTSTVTNTVAALNNLAAINPAQANVLKNIGISLNAGGCTSFNANTAATLIKNNSIQYNLAFTWKNVSFRLVIPKGANISDLVDPVTGQLYFYKLVQRYGLAGCTLIK